MQLTLTVLRCPPAVTPESRNLMGGEYTVGRGPGVDWVLGDVNQMVSRRHCTLAFRAGAWQVIDDSANGTFANHDDEPIGKGKSRNLRDNDRLRIGPYEIEVHLADEVYPGSGGTEPAGSYADDPFGDPLWPNDTESPRYTSAASAEDRDPFGRRGSASTHGESFANRTQDDHSPAWDDAMRPPNPIGQMPPHVSGPIPADDLLPDGWENDLLTGLSGSSPVAPPEPPPRPAKRSEKPAPLPKAAAPLAAAPSMQDDRPAAGDQAGLLAAFLDGAGLPDATPADPVATMHRLGEAYRALVSGLRAVLIARASIKSEFRIEQTLIRARGNNPLKFAANDDDAMSALLGAGRHTDMAPAKAVTDSLRDIRLHELASIAAMQSAVRALLRSLGPDKVRASLEPGSSRSMVPNQKKARAWDAYEALHARISQALSDDFDSVFGKAFARAYEEALDDLTAKDRS